MIKKTILIILLILIIFLGLILVRILGRKRAIPEPTMTIPPNFNTTGNYNVGFRTIQIPRPGTEPLVIALWYPTNQEPDSPPMKYRLIARELEADVAKDAAPLKGPFPLIISSHGGGVCGIAMAIYTEELASNGFIVAAPDHSDEFVACRSDRKLNVSVRDWLRWAHRSSTKIAAGIKQKALHRPKEIRITIDALLELNKNETSSFYHTISPEHIGITGASFGAWTTTAVSGAIPFFYDKRIKAAVPIVPTPARTDITRLKIPIMNIFGEKETMILGDSASPRKTEGMKQEYAKANPPKFLLGVKDAGHLDFGGAGAFNPKKDILSTKKVRLEDDVTAVTNKYVVAFFKRYLMNDSTAEEILTESDPRLFLFESEL